MAPLPEQNISEVFRRPQLLDEALHLPTLSKRLGLDDPSLAPSLSQQLGLPVACLSRAAAALRQQPEALVARLKQDVVTCVMADASYSPFSDVARQAAGEGLNGCLAKAQGGASRHGERRTGWAGGG